MKEGREQSDVTTKRAVSMDALVRFLLGEESNDSAKLSLLFLTQLFCSTTIVTTMVTTSTSMTMTVTMTVTMTMKDDGVEGAL